MVYEIVRSLSARMIRWNVHVDGHCQGFVTFRKEGVFRAFNGRMHKGAGPFFSFKAAARFAAGRGPALLQETKIQDPGRVYSMDAFVDGRRVGSVSMTMAEAEAEAAADVDLSDAICPCGDPDCSRPWGHAEDPEGGAR